MSADVSSDVETIHEFACPNWPHPGIVGCDYCARAEERGLFEAVRRLAARAAGGGRRVNAYMVRTKDERTYKEVILDDGTGPLHPCWPMSPVVAETPGRAKSLFIREFAGKSSSGVETDDFLNLRVVTLKRGVWLNEGVHEHDLDLWLLWDRRSGEPRG